MGDRTLDFVALGVLFFVIITIIYGIIFIHDIPYEIAKKRKHPHQDAIHTAGWVSLFLMHTIWPFLWIWATLYKPGYGWGFSSSKNTPGKKGEELIAELQTKLEKLETLNMQQNEEKAKLIGELHRRIDLLESELKKSEEG